jgi:hypothetical protein
VTVKASAATKEHFKDIHGVRKQYGAIDCFICFHFLFNVLFSALLQSVTFGVYGDVD